MTLSYSAISLDHVGVDLTKEVSTSGVLHTIIPARNSVIPLAGQESQGLVFEVENLTALLGTIRGQSSELGAQFQTQVGPNMQATLHLPHADDWSFSVTCPFKLSKVFALNFFPDANYEHIGIASPVLKVVGQALKRASTGQYETLGLTNIQFPRGYTKNDLAFIESFGADIVWKFGDFRIRHTGALSYYIPMSAVPEILAVGAQTPYKFAIDIFIKKKINPAFVAPEAALWAFENEIG